MLKLRDLLEIKVAKPEVGVLMKEDETFLEYIDRLDELSDRIEISVMYLHGDNHSFYAITPTKKGTKNPAYRVICKYLVSDYKIDLKEQRDQFYLSTEVDDTLDEAYRDMVAELQRITLNRDPTEDTVYVDGSLLGQELGERRKLDEIKIQAPAQIPYPEKGETVYRYLSRTLASHFKITVRAVKNGYNLEGTTAYIKNAQTYLKAVLRCIEKVTPVDLIKTHAIEASNAGVASITFKIRTQKDPYLTDFTEDPNSVQDNPYNWELPKGGEHLLDYLKSLDSDLLAFVDRKAKNKDRIEIYISGWTDKKQGGLYLHLQKLIEQPYITRIARLSGNIIQIRSSKPVSDFTLQSQNGDQKIDEIKVQAPMQVPVPEKGETVYRYFSRAVGSPYSVRVVKNGYNIGGTTNYMKNALAYFNNVLAFLRKAGPVKIAKIDVRKSFNFENNKEEQIAYTLNIQTNPYTTPALPGSEEKQEKTYTWELPKGGERLTNYLRSLDPNITVRAKIGPSVIIATPKSTWTASKATDFYLHVEKLKSQPNIKSITRPYEDQISIYLSKPVASFKLVSQSEVSVNEVNVQPKPQVPGYLAPFRRTIDYYLTSELEEPDYRAERNLGYLASYLKDEKLNGSIDIGTIVRDLKDYSKAFRADTRSRVTEIKVDKSPQTPQSLKPYKDKLDHYITHSRESDLDTVILNVLTYMLKLLGQDGVDLMKEVDLGKLLREVKAYVTAFKDYAKRGLKEIRVEPRQPVLVIGDRYLLFEPNPSVEGWVEAEYVGPYELSTARPYEEFNAQGRTFLIKKRDVLSRVRPAKLLEPKLELEQFEYYEVPGHNDTRVSSRYITRMWDTFYFLVETDTNGGNYYVEIPVQEVDQKVKAINKK